MKIKVCGMKYLSNIQALAALDIDYMGFIFYPKSKRFVGTDFNSAVLQSIPPYIEKIGVFVNEPMQSLIATANKYGFKTLQLHGNESVEYASEVSALGYTVIKAFSVDSTFDFKTTEPYKTYCKYFLFDTKSDSYGGTGQTFDWEILKNYNLPTPLFLSGGISLDYVQAIKNLSIEQLYALDLNSKFETGSANKNIDLISQFISHIH